MTQLLETISKGVQEIKEFRDQLADRIKSPFIGSLIITWCIYHWKVFAIIFLVNEMPGNWNKFYNLQMYFHDKSFCEEFWFPIFITLGVLLLMAILKSVGLALKLAYDNWAAPYIQKALYNDSIIEKKEYEKLKRRFSTMQSDLDEERTKRIDSESNSKAFETQVETLKRTSFQGGLYSDISQIFSSTTAWENTWQNPGENEGVEYFEASIAGFAFADKKIFPIENIKMSTDRKIIFFNKIIGDEILPNYLVRCGDNIFRGIEGDATDITYRPVKRTAIKILSAKYYSGEKYTDVTSVIRRLQREGKLNAILNNELMGGVDPHPNHQKTLNVAYEVDGKRFEYEVKEGNLIAMK